jgi:hypothetical protein
MRVGFVVRVSTMSFLRALRRKGMLKSWWGDVVKLVDGNEVNGLNLEVVGGVGGCVLG